MDERNNDFDFDFTPIGQAIKKARLAQGMTREQLSHIVDYNPRHLQAVENKGQKPSLELFICRACSITAGSSCTQGLLLLISNSSPPEIEKAEGFSVKKTSRLCKNSIQFQICRSAINLELCVSNLLLYALEVLLPFHIDLQFA